MFRRTFTPLGGRFFNIKGNIPSMPIARDFLENIAEQSSLSVKGEVTTWFLYPSWSDLCGK